MFVAVMRKGVVALGLAACIAAGATACARDVPTGAAPSLPTTPTLPIAYRNAAFTLSVNAIQKRVSVSAPTATLTQRVTAGARALAGGVQPSLLGGDVIDLVVTNYTAGLVGEEQPGKIAVRFDLQVINRLDGYQLTTPTFPSPPSGVDGMLAFPIEVSVLTSSGGVTSAGNEVTVTSPRFGKVVHSRDWDGELHNFFNDTGCPSTATDCYRYEPFGSVPPLGSSPARRVGFLIDPEVGDFRVKVIVAADLVPALSPTRATVRGTVLSNIGPVEGALVAVVGAGSGTTNATGQYSIGDVPAGAARTIALQALPNGCVSLQPTATVPIAAGAAVTQDFTATCPVPTAPIQGTITTTEGTALSGVQVVVTPTGGSALPAAVSSTGGAWSVANVPYRPSDSGLIALQNLPSNCSFTPTPYTGLTASGLSRALVVSCGAAPVTYALGGTWGRITATGVTGRQVTLTFAIDMGAAPGSPDIDGSAADALTGLSFRVQYDGALLDWTARQGLTLDPFDVVTVSEVNTGTAQAATSVTIGSSSGSTRTGSIALVQLTYDIPVGASGTVSPTVVLVRVGAGSLDLDVTSRVIVTVPPLTIPNPS